MKLSKIKEICPDFDMVKKDGKTTCLYKRGELCMHHGHFLCEIETFKFYSEKKKDRGRAPAMSHSRANMLDSCSRKYAFTYVHRVNQYMPTPDYFLMGDCFTIVRAKIDIGLEWDGKTLPKKLDPVDAARVRAALRWYQENKPYSSKLIVACEVPFHYAFEGHYYIGFADAVIEDSKGNQVIDEWKFAQKPYTKLQYIRQAAVYLKGRPQAHSFRGRTFIKPQLRPKKKGETMEAFEQRIYEDLCKKDKKDVIVNMVIRRDDIDVDEVLRGMKAKMNTLPVLEGEQFPPSYGSGCAWCDYVSYCEKHIDKTTPQLAKVIEADLRKV